MAGPPQPTSPEHEYVKSRCNRCRCPLTSSHRARAFCSSQLASATHVAQWVIRETRRGFHGNMMGWCRVRCLSYSAKWWWRRQKATHSCRSIWPKEESVGVSSFVNRPSELSMIDRWNFASIRASHSPLRLHAGSQPHYTHRFTTYDTFSSSRRAADHSPLNQRQSSRTSLSIIERHKISP